MNPGANGTSKPSSGGPRRMSRGQGGNDSVLQATFGWLIGSQDQPRRTRSATVIHGGHMPGGGSRLGCRCLPPRRYSACPVTQGQRWSQGNLGRFVAPIEQSRGSRLRLVCAIIAAPAGARTLPVEAIIVAARLTITPSPRDRLSWPKVRQAADPPGLYPAPHPKIGKVQMAAYETGGN